jgi:hypothetical protein
MIKTLRNLPIIDGYRVGEITATDDTTTPHDFKSSPILIDHEHNIVAFKIQDGPIKEAGVNGCQVDTLIETARLMVAGLNRKVPCPNNEAAVHALEAALDALRLRRQDREARGVEGTSKA